MLGDNTESKICTDVDSIIITLLMAQGDTQPVRMTAISSSFITAVEVTIEGGVLFKGSIQFQLGIPLDQWHIEDNEFCQKIM